MKYFGAIHRAQKQLFRALAFVVLLLACIAFPKISKADGPPVDMYGNITCRHYLIFLLSDSQKRTIERTHIFEFSSAQLKKAKEFGIGAIRKSIVFTPDNRDCTCGIPFYVVWNKPDRIVVPLWNIFYNFNGSYKPDPDEPDPIQEENKPLKNWVGHAILLGPDKKIYYRGKEINSKALEKFFSTVDKKNWLSLYLPPTWDENHRNELIKLAEEIQKIATKYKVDLDIELKNH